MSSYSRVVQEPEGESSGRLIGDGGVRKEWWWKAGPVDSCCFCFSLRAGVTILATIDLLYFGIFATFYLPQQMEYAAHVTIARNDALYAKDCTGGNALSQDCQDIKSQNALMENEMQLAEHLPAAYYIDGGIAIIAGIAGLLAVFNANALAAKVYMWTWLPRFVAMEAAEWMTYARKKEIGFQENLLEVIISGIIDFVIVAYFVKIVWSYHNRLNGSSNNSSSASEPAEGVQLRNGINGV